MGRNRQLGQVLGTWVYLIKTNLTKTTLEERHKKDTRQEYDERITGVRKDRTTDMSR